MIGIGHPNLDALARIAEANGRGIADDRTARHVERCARCRARVEVLRAAALRAASAAPPLPADFAGRVVMALPARQPVNGAIVGEVREVIGTILVDHPSAGTNAAPDAEAFPGMALREGDRVRALGDSLALITLNDGSALYINRNSEMEFPRRDAALRLAGGALLAQMRRQLRPFIVETPSAALTVIGTEFEAAVTIDKKTHLKVARGAVEMKTSAGRAVVRARRQAEAGAYNEPRPTRLPAGERVGAWAAPITSATSHQRGYVAMKALWILVMAVAIVGGVIVYNHSRNAPPEASPSSTTPPGSAASGWAAAVPPPSGAAASERVLVTKPPSNEDAERLVRERLAQGQVPQFLHVADDFQPVAPADTIGWNAEQVVRAFFDALVAKDIDKAVSFVAAPGDTIQGHFHEILRRYTATNEVQRINSYRAQDHQVSVVYTVLPTKVLGSSVAPTDEPGPASERTANLILEDTPTGLKIGMMKSDLFGRSGASPGAVGMAPAPDFSQIRRLVQEQIDKGNYEVSMRTTTLPNQPEQVQYLYKVTLPDGREMQWSSNVPLHKE